MYLLVSSGEILLEFYLIVAMITMGSVIVAIRELDTSFELTDFLSEEGMDIMEVRNEMYDSYEAAAWKSVILLVEPEDGGIL